MLLSGDIQRRNSIDSARITALESELAEVKSMVLSVFGVNPSNTSLDMPLLQFQGQTSSLQMSESHIADEHSRSISDLPDPNGATHTPFPPDTTERSPHPSPFPNSKKISEVLESLYQNASVISSVSAFLEHYFICKNTRVTNFQISEYQGLINDHDIEWPMLQWQEPDNDSEIFAIFKVNLRNGLSSTLLHTGVGGRQLNGKLWSQSTLAWWVLGMDDLRDLLIAARHILEVLNWPDPDLARQFFDPNYSNCSKEEYRPLSENANQGCRLKLFVQLLSQTLSRVKELEAHFDVASFWLERLSHCAGLFTKCSVTDLSDSRE
jgi:hypothetical protein